MKIALIVKQYRPAAGGVETYFRHVSEALLRAGHEVHGFLHRWDGSLHPKLQLHRVPMLHRPPLLKILSFSLFCHRMLRDQDFDIVYALTQGCPQDVHRLGGGLQRVWAKTRWTSPAVRAVMAAMRPSFLALMWLERRTLRPEQCRWVVTNSQLCRGQLLAAHPFPADRVQVIYNGVDHGRFHPGARQHRQHVRRALGIPEDEILLLHASHNFSRKGVPVLVEALARADRRFQLLVVGRGASGRYERLARRLNVGDRLHFAGEVEDVEAYYGAADAFVLPTQYDPFANVCLEAMACGLPVVTTAANGAAEIVHAGQGGIVIQDPGDVSALARALHELRDADRRTAMGRRALETSAGFTWESHAGELLRLFEKVVAEKRALPQIAGDGRIRTVGRMEISEAFRPQLHALGLDRFEGVMDFLDGERMKENRYRSVFRIHGAGAPALYLKRHKRRPALREFLAPFLRGALPQSSGYREWQNAHRLQALGIPTLEPVAWGERVRRLGIEQESFFLSAEIEGAERLEDFLPKRFRPPLTRTAIAEKRALIRQVASLVHSLHAARLYHRDLYLGHIFVREEGRGDFRLFLIDLQRVEQRRRLSWRWRIKDLATLNFTAPAGALTGSDRLRFFLAYLRRRRLGRGNRLIVRAVLRKTARIRSHTAVLLRRRLEESRQGLAAGHRGVR